MQSRRYPGVVSFTDRQQSIFFGRDNDIVQLQKYIRNRKSVLLYSKSGIGKSSLLNAGVLPQMQKDFLTLNIRFFLFDENAAPVSPLERVRLAIQPLIEGVTTDELDKLVNESHNEKPLWYYFKKLQSVENRKILLVFDQFEEFFSYPPEQKVFFCRVNDKIAFGGSEYVVQDISKNELILVDQSNQKKTSLPFTP